MNLDEKARSGMVSRGSARLPLLLVLAVLAGIAGFTVWYKLFRVEVQVLADDSDEELFKYGSIGTESENGMPYWIWHVLPLMFSNHLPGPGGYASLGIPWEEGRETPVGFSRKTIGFERININCAFCHMASVRESPDARPTFYPGGPSHTTDVLAYQRFLFDCANDPRFNPDDILAEIATVYELSFLDRLLYRYLLIPRVRQALLDLEKDFRWTEDRPPWGRGRIEPFNPVKVSTLRHVPGYGESVEVGETLGTSDMVPVWNLGLRVKHRMRFHWDGMNGSLAEVVRSSAIGDGATRESIPLDSLQRLQSYLMELPPPAYPFTVNQQLAKTGRAVYEQAGCASCHDPAPHGRAGEVVPAHEVGTDANRAQMWTEAAAAAYNAFAEGLEWDFDGFESTGGYVSVPLDAIWIRAPYLHNGSVPDLRALLEKAEDRPPVFYRGYDVYDQVRLGFDTQSPGARLMGDRFDTSERGNSNAGHEYGTELSDEEKAALLEYMKTL